MTPRTSVWLPALLALMLTAVVIVVAGAAVRDISAQNEAVKDRNEAVAEAERALWAVRRIAEFAGRWDPRAKPESNQDFDYLDTFRTLEDLVRPSGFLALTDDRNAEEIRDAVDALAYSEQLDAGRVQAGALALAPRLDDIRRGVWARKRDSYVDYYRSVQATSQRLDILFTAAVIALLIAVPFALFVGHRLHRRAARAASRAARLAEIREDTGDPMDGLSRALDVLDNRLRNEGSGSRLIDALDEERRRIALDMHDQVLTEVTALTRVAEALEENATDPTGPRNVKEGLRDLAADIRAVIDDLYPPVIETLGLEAALEGHLDRLRERFPDIQIGHAIDAGCTDGLSREKALSIYRVAREAMANAIRHAGADRIDVDLHRDGPRLRLGIEDNGPKVAGDTPPAFAEGRGSAGIRHRAARLGGTAGWARSRFTTGTKVTLEVPA